MMNITKQFAERCENENDDDPYLRLYFEDEDEFVWYKWILTGFQCLPDTKAYKLEAEYQIANQHSVQ